VPDLDQIQRSLNPGWRRPWNLLKGGHSLDLVAESLVDAVGNSIRRNAGEPAFESMVNAVAKHEARVIDSRTLQGMTRRMEQQFEHNRPRLQEFAQSLARDPTARSFRVPPRHRTRRKSTIEMLDEPLV
jgi:hypothetical protein